MTWNVDNFFRPDFEAKEEDEQRLQQKLELFAGVINRLAPDIVTLQESVVSNRFMAFNKLSAKPISTAQSQPVPAGIALCIR
jgi:hypothetical protein